MKNFLKKYWFKIILAFILVLVSGGMTISATDPGNDAIVQSLQAIAFAVIMLGVIYIFK